MLRLSPRDLYTPNHVHTCIYTSPFSCPKLHHCRYLSSTMFRTLRQYSYGSVCLSSSLLTHLKSV